MRLQMSLDRTDITAALKLLESVYDVIDIVEVGTPFIFKEGVRAVREIRAKYPSITILADMKIMDGGDYSSSLAFEAGADIVTVLAASADSTIKGVVGSAKRFGKQAYIDMINVKDITARAREADELGADYIGVHTAIDQQASGERPLEALRAVTAVLKNAKTAVAGGVDIATLPQIVVQKPGIIIAGKSITGSKDPRQTILDMKKLIGN